MKNFLLFNFILLLPFFLTQAQYPLPLAPEVWSIPEKVAIISQWSQSQISPSISFDKQYLYFEGLAVSEWSDTGWIEPYSLPNYINQHLARYPCISPNGKRLFFTWFWPGWDMYYSDWDSTINNWGEAINCGPNINTPGSAEGGCVLPNDSTLIFLRSSQTRISYWNKETETWGPAESWPTPNFLFFSDWGIYVSPDRKKVYISLGKADTTISGQYYFDYDIYVNYKDTTYPMGYKPPQILNFCLYADTQYFAGNYVDRFEGYPTLTPDGKKMYFTATYDSQFTIYESTMLIDENGNPVNVRDERETKLLPDEIQLFPVYPNPFNPNTTIKYQIPKAGNVVLKIYDILGREVATLVNEVKSEGRYEVNFDASSLASGVYLYSMQAGGFVCTKKMILIK